MGSSYTAPGAQLPSISAVSAEGSGFQLEAPTSPLKAQNFAIIFHGYMDSKDVQSYRC